jgi:PAS domain S-box-containing protein
VLIFDASGTVIDANDAFLTMSGHGRDAVEARALTWRLMTPPEHVAANEHQMRLLGKTGRIGPHEKQYYRKDGSRSWMLFAGTSLGDGTVIEFCVDIDDRKRAEEALRLTRPNTVRYSRRSTRAFACSSVCRCARTDCVTTATST